MSYYYKYNFISPESVYATVKEELKSYFDTGAVDDLLFPTYLDKCLRKLGRSSYVISEDILDISDFQARLPDNFIAVREAWMCTEIPLRPYQDSTSFYSQASSQTTIQISPLTIGGTPCVNAACQDAACTGTCMPELIQAVYKTNQSVARGIAKSYLLKPGNISARSNCSVEYTNAWQFASNFRCGVVHLIFYVTEYDCTGNQMIPDNYRIKEFIEHFIKYKVFETLSNQLTDETFAQIQQKMLYYKGLADEAFVMADIEIKKQTPWAKQRRIKNDLQRFAQYELPNRSRRN